MPYFPSESYRGYLQCLSVSYHSLSLLCHSNIITDTSLTGEPFRNLAFHCGLTHICQCKFKIHKVCCHCRVLICPSLLMRHFLDCSRPYTRTDWTSMLPQDRPPRRPEKGHSTVSNLQRIPHWHGPRGSWPDGGSRHRHPLLPSWVPRATHQAERLKSSSCQALHLVSY